MNNPHEDAQNPQFNKIPYSNKSKDAVHDNKTEQRYQYMMSKLTEEQKLSEKERIKSAKAVADSKSSKEIKIRNETNPGPQIASKNSIKAPNELLEEFLVYIMAKNWEDAHKLCGFILIYEPHNALAKEYMPILTRKVEQILSQGESEDETGSDGSGASSTESDESDSSEDSDDYDSDYSDYERNQDDNDDVEIPGIEFFNEYKLW